MPTSEITKKALASSMKKLMETMPFPKISVGKICEKCGTSRKTFYYHFRDKYELVNWIFYTELISYLEKMHFKNESKLLLSICSYFYDNMVFYSNAFNVNGQNSFSDFFSETIHSLVSEYIRDQLDEGEFCDFYCTFMTNALRVSIIEWLKDGAQTPPDKFAGLLEQSFMGIAKSP
jgi:probable dihydroxyacetone kinase regulator